VRTRATRRARPKIRGVKCRAGQSCHSYRWSHFSGHRSLARCQPQPAPLRAHLAAAVGRICIFHRPEPGAIAEEARFEIDARSHSDILAVKLEPFAGFLLA